VAEESLRLIEVERQLRDLTEETIRTGERAIAVATVVGRDRAETQRHQVEVRDALTACTTKLTSIAADIQEIRSQQARLTASHEAAQAQSALARMERLAGSVTWPGVVMLFTPIAILLILWDNQIKTFILSITQVVYGR